MAVVVAGLANATRPWQHLHEQKFGTLLFDLLTEEEDKNYYNRFDIDLLTERFSWCPVLSQYRQ